MREYSKKFTKLEILPQTTKENHKSIIEFLKKDDIDYIVNMNDECLSLIINAFIYVRNKEKTDVEGLDKNMFLPFLAIGLVYFKGLKNKLLILSEEMSKNILDDCNLLSNNDSPLSIMSINSILTNMSYLDSSFTFRIIEILIKLLVNNSYMADKVLLLSIIFKLSCQNPVNQQTTDLLDKYGVGIFVYIIKNMEHIPDFSKLMNYSLNLKSFNSKNIINMTEKIFQKSSPKNVLLHTICFLERYCKNVPKFEISNINLINKEINHLIQRNKWDEILIIGHFLKNNNFENNLQQFLDAPIPIKKKEILFNDFPIDSQIIDQLVNNVLNDSEPEIYFTSLFKVLMKEKPIAMDYLNILFEKISSNEEIEPEKILELYYNEYEIYGDVFIDALRRSFGYHSIHKHFIRKAIFKSITIPISQFGQLLISKLFAEANSKKANYKIFLCLRNVSSSFPFLFVERYLEILDTFLPLLNDFSLYFIPPDKEINEEQINKLKISLAVYSFLNSLLYSVGFLDVFVPWIYQNIINFTYSQILAYSFILSSLFKSPKIQDIMVALAIKYNFIGVIGKLFKKEHQKDSICYFKNNFYDILFNFYSILNSSSKTNKIIIIDEIQNIECLFKNKFNNFSTIFPFQLYKLDLPVPPNQISEFVNKMNKIECFWLIYDFSINKINNISKDVINSFISHYLRLEPNIPDVKNMPKISHYFSYNVKMIRLLAHQPDWVYKYITSYSSFNFLPEHISKLQSVINKLNTIKNQSNDDIESKLSCNNINADDYFLSEYCQNELFQVLICDIITHNRQQLKSICTFIKALIQNGVALLSLIDLINRLILHTYRNFESTKPIKKLVNVLISSSSQKQFRKFLMEICGNNLIELALSPDCRCNSKLLSKFAQLYCLCDKIEHPIHLSHLIGFMLSFNHSEIIPEALSLCQKVGESNLNNIKVIIENSFEREFTKENPSCIIIDGFVQKVPLLIQDKISSFPKLLSKVISEYQSNGENDENSVNLICTIFDILAPGQNKSQFMLYDEVDLSFSLTSSLIEPSSLQSADFIVNHVPEKLRETNENFWILFEDHRNIINEILLKDESKLEKMKFLFNYPELLSFKVRFKYFTNKMKDKINKNYSLSLHVDRSNILVSSYGQLKNKKPNEWLHKLSIRFNGEKGVDAGGLTKEWFTLIAQELFNTNNALYKSSENKSYQPNPASYINAEHIDYFKFSGKFIARALIHGQCVNAHLMRSFCRQILGVQLKIKDLEDFDEELFHSLKMILDTDVEPLDLDFTIDVNEYGVNKTILLKDDGDKITVTNENKAEYVRLYANYHLRKSIIQQINAFCEGFYSLIPQEDIHIFSPEEFDLMICGIPEINIDDLKRNTHYHTPYSSNHPVIITFFNLLSKWDNEKKAKLLLFITGSSQVPVRGFKDYEDRGKPITICDGGDKNRFCVAHTCFNKLDLPQYETEEEMNQKILLSIQESEFGLA